MCIPLPSIVSFSMSITNTAETSEFSIEKPTPLHLHLHNPNMGNPRLEDAPELELMSASLEEEQLAWSRVREYCMDAFSEFFGTMVLILFGDGVVAQVVLSGGAKGDYQSISWGWG